MTTLRTLLAVLAFASLGCASRQAESRNAGRGGRCVDAVRRAQIADGVRGPRAAASESTRRAECAAPCLSPHGTGPAGELAFCCSGAAPCSPAASQRTIQPARRQDLTASVCGFCASWEFPEGCDAGVSGHVKRRGFDHAVELEPEDVIVGEVRARSNRAVRAGPWVPEDEAGVCAGEDESAVGQRHHVADVVFLHPCIAPRVVIAERLPV